MGAMDSMQASLESEQRAKAEALRIKKKLEGDINELEIALDHANKVNSEAQRAIKRYQGQMREAECAYEEEQRQRQEVAEKASLADRRANALAGEMEEEFENTRKNHARAMDSMQASLESEQRAKAEALRIKKKLEGDINELEIALDHANKANSEAQK